MPAPPTTAASPFLAACQRRPVSRTPVWFMRQAGRSLPEYLRARAGLPLLESCQRPDLVAEITLQPVHRYQVDAAVLFSDIVLPLAVAGLPVRIAPGRGPVLDDPVRDRDALLRVRAPEPDQLDFLAAAVQTTAAELGPVPLIGFAGAPFTLASYLVEGGPSRSQERTRALMYGNETLWHELLARLAEVAVRTLRAQVDAGASAVQLFDSWVGAVSAPEYRRYVQPHSTRVLAAVTDVPRIHFGLGTGELLGAMVAAGADVIGVDWRLPLDQATARAGPDVAVQGNLDPAALFAPWPRLAELARDVLRRGRAAPGHVFNLGHGVPPDADPAVLARLVDLVHQPEHRPPGEPADR